MAEAANSTDEQFIKDLVADSFKIDEIRDSAERIGLAPEHFQKNMLAEIDGLYKEIAPETNDLRIAEERRELALRRRKRRRVQRVIRWLTFLLVVGLGYMEDRLGHGVDLSKHAPSSGTLLYYVWWGFVWGIWVWLLTLIPWAGEYIDVQQAEQRVRTAEQSRPVAARDRWVLPLMRAEINRRLDPSFSSRLEVREAPFLAEVFLPQFEVPTASRMKIERLFRLMPAGSIGLSGYRGSGKTTLINTLCTSTHSQDRTASPVLGITVAVPVRYEPRDFILHLFGRICREALGLPASDDPSWPHRGWRWSPVVAVILPAVMILLVATVLLRPQAFNLPDMSWLPVGWYKAALIGSILFGLIILARGWFSRRAGGGAQSDSSQNSPLTSTENRDEIWESARNWLSEIRFQQSYSTSWSGSLKLPLGASASRSKLLQLESRQRSLPDIVDGFRDLLKRIGAGVQVRIGIDEMDKLESEDAAESFLNEIKSVFGISNCFYLVSISENAMSGFERRGLPLRDAFDSSFDEVIRIDAFDYDFSKKLLDRRVVDMPVPFVALCHCLSGGLPRDLIRAARRLLELNQGEDVPESGGDISLLCHRLVAEDLQAKMAAVWVAARPIKVEPPATQFRDWLWNMQTSDVTADALLSSCKQFWTLAKAWSVGESATTATEEDFRRLLSLGLELSGYRYFAATLLDFFNSTTPNPQFLEAIQENAGVAGVRTLAHARATFAQDPRLAWSLVSQFRKARKLRTLSMLDPSLLHLPPRRSASVTRTAQHSRGLST
jgi:hypothetical protein